MGFLLWLPKAAFCILSEQEHCDRGSVHGDSFLRASFHIHYRHMALLEAWGRVFCPGIAVAVLCAVVFDLIRYSSWILHDMSGDMLEIHTFPQTFFNHFSVLDCEMLVLLWIVFSHDLWSPFWDVSQT